MQNPDATEAIPKRQTTLFVTLSFRRRKNGSLADLTFTRNEYNKFLPEMTHIFRANFWATFSRVEVFQPKNRNIEIFGKLAKISDVLVLQSADSDFDGIEGNDFLISFHASFAEGDDELRERKVSLLSDQPSVEYYTQLLASSVSEHFLDNYGCEPGALPGVSSQLTSELIDSGHERSAAAVSAFFHYGWIVLLRLERAQLDLKISASSGDILYSAEDIIEQRVRLINIKRRFLTHDRTNNRSLRKHCASYREKFNMDRRFDTLNTVHELFEHHLDNTSKVIQAKRTQALSKALNLLTFLAIPLGVIGTILAIDLQGSFLTDPNSVAGNSILWFLVGGTFGAVIGIVALARLIDMHLSKRK